MQSPKPCWPCRKTWGIKLRDSLKCLHFECGVTDTAWLKFGNFVSCVHTNGVTPLVQLLPYHKVVAMGSGTCTRAIWPDQQGTTNTLLQKDSSSFPVCMGVQRPCHVESSLAASAYRLRPCRKTWLSKLRDSLRCLHFKWLKFGNLVSFVHISGVTPLVVLLPCPGSGR